MENQEKKKIVATLTPQELAAFKAWRIKHLAVEQTARLILGGAMRAVQEIKQEVVRENLAFFEGMEKAHGLPSDRPYHIDLETGAVEECQHEHGAVMILGGGMPGMPPDLDDEPTKH